jgi:hypothetical protein
MTTNGAPSFAAAPVVESASMAEPDNPGLLYVLGLAIVGCLAFALFTDEWLWTGMAIATAGGLAAWGYRVAKRLYGDDEDSLFPRL